MSQKQSELESASTDQALTNSETTQKKAEVILTSYQRNIASLDSIPPALQNLPIWCAWRLVKKAGKAKPDKVPISPLTGRGDKWTETGFCTTAQRAIDYTESRQDLYGIGLVLYSEIGIAGGDLDNCRNPKTGEKSELAAEILASANTYTEISPSLRGYRFLVFGSFGGYTGNNKEQGVELYESNRFLTFTGNQVEESPFAIEQRDLTELGKRFFEKKQEPTGGNSDLGTFEPVDISTLNLKPWTVKAITTGGGGHDRSVTIYRVIKDLLRAGCDNLTVCRVLADPRYAIAVKALENRRGNIESAMSWVEPQVAKARQEIADERMIAKTAYDDFLAQIESTDDPLELAIDLAPIVCSSALPEAIKRTLLKQIAKRAGTTVSALQQDMEAFSHVAASKDDDHLKAAKEVVSSFGENNLITCESGTWDWMQSRGSWARVPDREIKQRVHAVAGGKELTSNIVSSVLDLVKTESFIAGHRFNAQSVQGINVANGVLNRTNGKWELSTHRREDFQTTLIPVRFDPTAKAPRFEQFLTEVFDEVRNSAQLIQVIRQGFGYTLLPSCHLERFFLLIGAGANGKSVLLSTLTSLVGQYQVCAVQPSQFGDRFQRAHLDGKLANIVTEIAEGGEIADAQLKALTSGELTTAEFKFQQPFDFRPIATFWFGTNHLPHTRDFSDALFRRAILIEFPRVFQEHERDPNLTKKLQQELPGILNFALDGLDELFTDGRFSVPESSVELAEGWRLEADQAHQFIDECCERDKYAEVEVAELYAEYREWAKNSGISRIVQKKTFGTRLERLGFKRSRTKLARLITGVRIAIRQPLS